MLAEPPQPLFSMPFSTGKAYEQKPSSVSSRERAFSFEFDDDQKGAFEVSLVYNQKGSGRPSSEKGKEISRRIEDCGPVLRRAVEVIVSDGSRVALLRLEGGNEAAENSAYEQELKKSAGDLAAKADEQGKQLAHLRVEAGRLRDAKDKAEQQSAAQLVRISDLEKKIAELENRPALVVAPSGGTKKLAELEKKCTMFQNMYNGARADATNYEISARRAVGEKIELEKKVAQVEEDSKFYVATTTRLFSEVDMMQTAAKQSELSAAGLEKALSVERARVANLENELSGKLALVADLKKSVDVSAARLHMAGEAVSEASRARETELLQLQDQIEIEREKKVCCVFFFHSRGVFLLIIFLQKKRNELRMLQRH